MSHLRRHPKSYPKRQAPVDPHSIPSLAGVSGAQTVDATPTGGPLALDPDATTNVPGATQPLASFTPTVTTLTNTPSPTPTDGSEPPSVVGTSSASKSQLPIGTVVAACVGAFAGAIFLISIFLWWLKRPVKSRSRAATNRASQRQLRGRSWNRLGDDEDRWEGNSSEAGAANKGVEMRESQKDADEKNFPMFKKTNSMRTTRTARALEEHGIDLPPFEFSQYHPTLAEELSLEHPDKPFAARQNSGSSSWDRGSLGDDSFLSLRSVRVESGTMSPTLAHKMTPVATSHSSVSLHKWESAEVVHMQEPEPVEITNPFADVHEERARGGNPFFGAGDMVRTPSRGRRSRSNSRSSRHSRATSRTSRTSRPTSRVRPDSETNPFGDDAMPSDIPPFKPQHHHSDSTASDVSAATAMPAGIPFYNTTHHHSDSTASNASGTPAATEQAMKNLIAALNLSPEEVQERLRVASMQSSTASRYSGLSASIRDDESDVATITGFPAPPVSPLSPHSTHAR